MELQGLAQPWHDLLLLSNTLSVFYWTSLLMVESGIPMCMWSLHTTIMVPVHCCWFSKSWYPIHWQKSNKENRTRELFFKLRWGPCLPSCGTSSAQPFNHLVPSWNSFYLLEMGLFNLCIDSRFVRVRNWHIEVEPKYLSKYWQIKNSRLFPPCAKHCICCKKQYAPPMHYTQSLKSVRTPRT